MRLILALVGLLFSWTYAISQQQGPSGPGTAVTSGSTSYNWTNASNAAVDNSNAATATIVGKGSLSNTLRLTNFGFSIPVGATINGILVEIRMQGSNGKTKDQVIQLRKLSGLVGANKARSNAIWPRNSARYIRFGGSSDLWGTTWAYSDINNAAFGIDIVAKSRKNTALARVEFVRITVTYNQTQFYSKSSGDLHTLATWGTNTNGTGTAPTSFSANGQVFNLRNRATATLSANLTITGTGSKLVNGDGSATINLTIPSGFAYSGLVDVSNNSTLTLNNTSLPTLGTISRSSNGGVSTIVYGAVGAQSIEGRAFHNLIISSTGTKTLAGTSSAEGKLTINSGATFSDGGYIFLVEDDIQNSGTHVSGTDGVLIMNGTASQSITGTNGVFGNLEIDNTAGVSLATSITVTGDLSLSEGPLIISTYTLNLSGTTTNTVGTLTGGTSANLTISGTGSLGTLNFTTGSQSLNNLTLNRTTGDMTLGTPLNVRNVLTLTNGNILNGSNAITLGTSTSSRGTLSRSSGTVVGVFTRWFSNATNSGITGLFPVGTAIDYRPAQIEFTSAPSVGGRLTAQFIEAKPGNAGLPLLESSIDINKAGESGYWGISATSLTGGIYTGTFTGTNYGGVLDYTTLHMIKRTNSVSNWVLHGTHQATTGSNLAPVLKRTAMTSYGEYGVGGDKNVNPLPVELIFFTAVHNANTISFHWATASEINNDFFELEQSYNGVDWIVLAVVHGNGNTSERKDYYYEWTGRATDAYYRLKQVDYDGALEYLNMIFVTISSNNFDSSYSVYPNPASSGSIVYLSNYDQLDIQDYHLIYMDGKKIVGLEQLQPWSYQLPALQSGIYFLVLKTYKNQVIKIKLIIE
jgi:hypothetical protein